MENNTKKTTLKESVLADRGCMKDLYQHYIDNDNLEVLRGIPLEVATNHYHELAVMALNFFIEKKAKSILEEFDALLKEKDGAFVSRMLSYAMYYRNKYLLVIDHLTRLVFLEKDTTTPLRKLHAWYNSFKEISYESFLKLSEINLSGREIKEIPPELGQMTWLTELYLNQNKIEVIPSELGLLKNLRKLDLESNQIKVIPSELCKLQNLEALDLSNNQIEVIPSELSLLKNLGALWLTDNKIRVIPSELSQLQALRLLYLSNNQIEIIPSELHQLQSLKALGLSRNQIVEIPPELSQISGLTCLWLTDNKVTVIPKEFCNRQNFQIDV